MIGTAILDLVVGALMLIDYWTWLAALIGALHIMTIFVTVGINVVTVRDIGIFASSLALIFSALPQSIIDKLPFLSTPKSPDLLYLSDWREFGARQYAKQFWPEGIELSG